MDSLVISLYCAIYVKSRAKTDYRGDDTSPRHTDQPTNVILYMQNATYKHQISLITKK